MTAERQERGDGRADRSLLPGRAVKNHAHTRKDSAVAARHQRGTAGSLRLRQCLREQRRQCARQCGEHASTGFERDRHFDAVVLIREALRTLISGSLTQRDKRP